VPDGHGLVPSSGGLASALREIHQSRHCRWVGWLGETSELSEETVERLHSQARALRLTPVRLSANEVSLYYDGYANSVLWPLFHYLLDKVCLDESEQWQAYVDVNQRFADAVAAELRDGDTVWIHDYHLALLPALLRKQAPSVRIGFFLHIPWPSSDVFRILPSRVEVLTGLLGADLLGFQTESYRQNFLQSAAEVLGVDLGTDTILWEERPVRVGVHPIGVDVARFTVQNPEIDAMIAEIRANTHGKKIVLGVDRLDYTKGVPRRLLAIDRLLEREPGLRDKLHYIQIAVPTREGVDAYAELRRSVNELVSRINSRHGTTTSSPVQLLYRSISHDHLVALYRAADVMLVTPLRDGMNLVAKEYVAARVDERGVLVLSEFAGAASELATALAVNAYDVVGLSRAIERAMFMREDEQRVRMLKLHAAVHGQTVQDWAADFVDALLRTTPSLVPSASLAPDIERALARLSQAAHRTLLLDYDGTLASIAELPGLAAPDDALLDLLRRLSEMPDTAVHVVTGRSQESIEPWLGMLPIWLHVEHGLRSRNRDGTWLEPTHARPSALDTAAAIMQRVAERTQGMLLEPKRASVAFHYRRANPIVTHDCIASLKTELENAIGPDLQVLEGHKVLEVRLRAVNKRTAVLAALAMAPANTLALAVGDDRTDEDMFAALPDDGLSIRVGKGPSNAKLRVESPEALRELLGKLLSSLSSGRAALWQVARAQPPDET
jgi:trehalose 6-phosphate synthase/phosphatase